MNKEYEEPIVKIGFDYDYAKKDKNIIYGSGIVCYYDTKESYDNTKEDSCIDFKFKYNIDECEIFDVECNDEETKNRIEADEDNFIDNIITNLLPKFESHTKNKYDSFNATNFSKICKFNELCGSWDFRDIDMTEPHLACINIKNNNVYITCELYSPKLEDYVSCSGGIIKSKKIINDFVALDLNDKYDVKDFITDVEDKVKWENVCSKLEKMENQELKKYKIIEEEEMEYDR